MSAAAREALLRRMAELGWMNPQIMPESEATAARGLEAEALAHLVVQDRREVWRLTDAGEQEAAKL